MFKAFQRFIEDANNESIDEADGLHVSQQRDFSSHQRSVREHQNYNNSYSDDIHGRNLEYLRPEDEISRNNRIIENITAMQNENQASNFEKILHYNHDNQILGMLLTNYLNENPELRSSIMRETGDLEDSELFQRMAQQLSFLDNRNSNFEANNIGVDHLTDNNSFVNERINNLFQQNQRNSIGFINTQNFK